MMRGTQPFAVLILMTALLAGCLQTEAPQGAPDDPETAAIRGPHAVIGVIDSGINPYHTAFRDDSERAFVHPSEYLPDYPEDAVAINITFDHESIPAALEADCRQWAKVEPGRLYWFPGTRIVGAYANPGQWEDLPYQDSTRGAITCDDTDQAAWGNIFGSGSHGTLVTSRAAANDYGACEECLIVAVQGLGPDAVTWVAEQPWIDLSNHSWGPQVVPLYQPSGMPVPRLAADRELLEAVEAAAQKQTAIWGSGNGLLFRYGVLGLPTQAAAHMTPSAIRVGAHDNGHVTIWHGSFPHIVADACGPWTASHTSLDQEGPSDTGGTSFAAPFAAGLAGKILIEARTLLGDNATGVRDGVLAEGTPTQRGPLDDGILTKDEFEQLLLATATTKPDAFDEDGDVCDPTQDPLGNPVHLLIPGLPVMWRDVPEGPAGIPLIGYGAVTPATAEYAREVLRGEESLPERSAQDAYFEADRFYGEGAYGAFTMVP